MNFFSSNEHFHAEPEQLKRIKSALQLKMDSVDFDTRTGKIKNYDVSLGECTCMDFMRRRKPCKHIYRLAVELGIFKPEATGSASRLPAHNVDNKDSVDNSSAHIFSYLGVVPENFVVIDFETANTFPDSICQMGIAVVESNLIVDRKSFLVRPPYDIFNFTDIHGITFDDVKSEPTFDMLWHKMSNYIEGHTVAAYNLPFDLNCLLAVLSRYKIPRPNFSAFDVMANVRACRYFNCALSELENYKLVTIAKKLGLEHRAHDALSDSVVTAQTQIYLSKTISELKTTIYLYTISSLTEAIAKNQISPANIAAYCNELFKDAARIDYDDYKELFKLIEQVATIHDNASLYKYCGMFYERFNRLSRALSLYEQALSLNEKIGLKGKMQRLRRELHR